MEFDTTDSGYTLTKTDDTKWHFDSTGVLQYIADRNNNQITLIYSSDTLKTINNASGRRLILEYNDSGKIDTLKDGSGRVLVTYVNDIDTAMVIHHVSASKADTTKYIYQSLSATCPDCIIKIENSDGSEYNYQYDGYKKVSSFSQKNGVNSINFNYTCRTGTCPTFIETKVIDAGSDTSIYSSTWDPCKNRRRLAKIENSGSGVQDVEFTYGVLGKIIRKKYKNGVADSFAYDQRGNMIREYRAVNSSLEQLTKYYYNSNYNLPDSIMRASIVNPSNNAKTIYSYDSNGNLTSVKDSGMVDTSNWYYDSTNYAYNSYGQLVKIDGPRDNSTDVVDSTVFTYDTLWNELASVIQYVSDTFLVTTYSEYDSLGNPQLIIGPDSVKTRYFYDGRGRTNKIINGSTLSDSTITQYAYNSLGNVTQIIRANGDTLKYNYDSANRLASIVNGVNDSLKYTYDIESRLTKKEIVNSFGVVTWYENYGYDTKKDLLTKIIGPYDDTTIFRYDQVGNRVFKRDAMGDSVDFRYDDLNRLTTVVQWKDEDSLKTIYTHDLRNNLETVTDADNNTTSYKYSDKGHITQDSSAVTGVTKYEYDEAGNLVKKKDSEGDSILYYYDALNRLTLIKFQDTTRNIAYDYDGASSYRIGRLYKEEAPYDTITYSYEYTGLLDQEIKKIDGVTYTTKYSYDKNGNLTYMEYPNGRKLYYYYDKADQLDSLRTTKFRTTKRLITDMDYAPYGGPTSFTYGNGITTTIKYNQRYWVDSLATDTNITRRKYYYDKVGNIVRIDDLVKSAKSESLAYDDLNRLTFAVSDSFYSDTLSPARDTIWYVYSDAGNRMMEIMGYDTTFYHYSSNKLDSITGYESAIYRYDNKGNMILKSTTADDTLDYDQL
ncbi:MAG: hypothetical protein OEV55_04790, partial [candidate division Zixibacteria bacterium]|nr:hypothetical protein [candidate division Zixibacteria bacterium]